MNRRLISIIIIIVLLLAIPITLYLARQTQIFKPRAAGAGTGVTPVDVNGTPLPPASDGIPEVSGDSVRLQIKYVP